MTPLKIANDIVIIEFHGKVGYVLLIEEISPTHYPPPQYIAIILKL